MKKYLVLNYPGRGAQSDDAWTDFFAAVRKSGKFSGGSALGQRWGFSDVGFHAPQARAIGGYFLFTAGNEGEVAEMLKSCPIITAGGSVDIIALETD